MYGMVLIGTCLVAKNGALLIPRHHPASRINPSRHMMALPNKLNIKASLSSSSHFFDIARHPKKRFKQAPLTIISSLLF
jgi:hypothetical protein